MFTQEELNTIANKVRCGMCEDTSSYDSKDGEYYIFKCPSCSGITARLHEDDTNRFDTEG
jgi:Zn finger protein HypA/HybF involved in hydrogenase expression